MRDSIVFYDSWGRMICDLPDEQAAALIKMIFNYTFNDLVIESDNITVGAIFGMIREKLDEDARAWEETRRRRSEGGKKGMSSRWGDNSVITHDNSVKDSYAELNEVITPITVSDSVSVSVSDKDIKSERRFTPPSLEEVSAYISEKGYSIDAEAFVDFYSSKGWMIGKNKIKDWKAAVRTWARRDNTPKPEAKPSSNGGYQKDNAFKEYDQRSDYDYDALEKMLTAN